MLLLMALRSSPKAFATSKKKTEDCEAMARRGSWIYIFGSHFGSKSGPMESSRHFVARFDESRIQGSLDEAEIPIEIALREACDTGRPLMATAQDGPIDPCIW